MKRLILILVFIIFVFSSCINNYTNNNVYSDETLQQIIESDMKLKELKARYPTEYERRLGDIVQMIYYGDTSVAVVYFESDGNKSLTRIFDASYSKDVYEQLQIGQSLDEVKKIDPNGHYLFLYSGRDEPRVSKHYTNDKYFVQITYDENHNITDISINPV